MYLRGEGGQEKCCHRTALTFQLCKMTKFQYLAYNPVLELKRINSHKVFFHKKRERNLKKIDAPELRNTNARPSPRQGKDFNTWSIGGL